MNQKSIHGVGVVEEKILFIQTCTKEYQNQFEEYLDIIKRVHDHKSNDCGPLIGLNR